MATNHPNGTVAHWFPESFLKYWPDLTRTAQTFIPALLILPEF
jgi:hypothetical protein